MINNLNKQKIIKMEETHSISSSKSHQKNNKNNNSVETINNLLNSNITLFQTRSNYELMYEAFYISNLFYEMHKTKKHLKDQFFYILNLDWFAKWKKYVNYDFYTSEKNWKKYMNINTLPYRPNSPFLDEQNYLKNINNNTKKKIEDFFDIFFLNNNENLYPGYINNKKFLVDKNQNNKYLYKCNLENNFNILDEFTYNKDYIWVTEDIWKYFYCIYGGYEIRRKNLNLNNNDNNALNIILEPKLKIFNLIIFNYNRNYTYNIIPPKYLNVSHNASIGQFKKILKNIFPILSNFDNGEIHIFYLDQKYDINSLAQYVKQNNNYINGINSMNFPGICLNLLNDNYSIEYIEEKILNINNKDTNNISNIVLEIPFIYKEKNKKIFLFQTGKNLIKSENEENMCINLDKSYYDKIEINVNDINDNFIINDKLFLIKNYFYNKYAIDKLNECKKNELNIHLKKVINNFKEEKIKNKFNIEINELKKNLDLIFDKNFLIDNIPNLYLNELYINSNNEKIKNNKKEVKFLSKKRLKFNENFEENSDNISWYSCGFCNQTLNYDYIVCDFCLNKKYCNFICRRKDIKNHLQHCGK